MDGKRGYAFTGRGGGSIALDVGGKGDVSESNTVWTGNENASFASPVRHKSRLYVVSRGVLTVVDAETGERLDQIRLKGARQTGGRFGSLDYASPIVVGDRLYYLNGSGQMFVFDVSKEDVEQVSVNLVTNEKETFWGSPAVSSGRMVLRSSKHLYCVMDKGETPKPTENVVARADPPAPGRGNSASRPGGGGPSGPAAGPGGRGPGGRGPSGRFDPAQMFNGMDTDKDGKVTMAELEGNRMADRLKTLDKDGDDAISKDEFTSGIAGLFSRGGGSNRGGGGYRSRGNDTRPDRPQRPESAGV